MTPPIRMVSGPVDPETRSAIAQMICGHKLRQGKRTDTDKEWSDALDTADRIAAMLTAAPVREEGGAVDAMAAIRLLMAALGSDPKRAPYPIFAGDVHAAEASAAMNAGRAALTALATREEAPAEAGEAPSTLAKALEDFLVERIEAWKLNDADAIDAAIEKTGAVILSICSGEDQ